MPTPTKENRHLYTRQWKITVEGDIDPSWSEWFGDMKLTRCVDKHGFPITQLIGTLPDQGALRGVLNKLWDLNLTLRSVQCKIVSSRRNSYEKTN